MAKWFHEVSLEWLEARQRCLTATDVKDLIPYTKTGRKRDITDETYLKVLSRKLVKLTKQDCVSTGAAARGHVLEPYAVEFYNLNCKEHEGLFHWDDMIVTRPVHANGNLAFSPDAMTIDPNSPLLLEDSVMQGIAVPIWKIGEVKCYSADKHLACGYTSKDKLEERWQLATAMAVSDTIDEAVLMFYNPSMAQQMFVVTYDRADLEDEIATVLDIEKNWQEWLKKLGTLDRNEMFSGDFDNEMEIIKMIMKREELNPESAKSVVV